MAAEMKKFIRNCDVYQKFGNKQQKKPIIHHDVGDYSWSKVGLDLCILQVRILLICVDYNCGYIEVRRSTTITSMMVIKLLNEWFARHGIPKKMVSDNGKQFDSWEFMQFTEKLDIEHMISSPRYPQSNGHAENEVITVKKLFKKAREVGHIAYQALFYCRNTPTEGIGLFPAQRLLGKRCHTLVPTTQQQLKPRYPTKEEKVKQVQMKEKLKWYYNQHVKYLQPLQRGDMVRMQLPGDQRWIKGVCEGAVAERSYRVKVGDTSYRWNRVI